MGTVVSASRQHAGGAVEIKTVGGGEKKKMSRKIIAILFAATLVMSAAAMGMAAAKTTTQKIEFDFDEGWYDTSDPATGEWTSVPASAVLTGNIKDKDGTQYLSPQTGTITIDGIEHQIQVKQPKQSEPVMYYEYEWGTPGAEYYKYQEWYKIVEVNIEGDKYIGWLYWGKYHYEYYGEVWDYEYSYLSFQGIADGKMANCWLHGDFPEIG